MEFTSWQMYWLLMLDNINSLCSVIFSLGCVVIVVSLLCFYVLFEETPWNKILKFYKIIIPIYLIAIIIGTFIPSTKQMAAIIVVPKIINNEKIQQLPEQLLNLGIEWLEDIAPKKEIK